MAPAIAADFFNDQKIMSHIKHYKRHRVGRCEASESHVKTVLSIAAVGEDPPTTSIVLETSLGVIELWLETSKETKSRLPPEVETGLFKFSSS